MSLTQKGSTLNPSESRFGISVDVSRDGSRIIVGASSAGTNQKGKAFIYDYDDGTSSWTQIGSFVLKR